MTPHAMNGAGGPSNYGTPPGLFAHLDRRFRFTYDPFAEIDNRMPVRRFSTIVGTARVTRGGVVVSESLEDGFAHSWRGERVFFNPPYRPTGILSRVVDKAIAELEEAEIIVGILPVDTSVAWWHALIEHAHLEYLRGRPAFIDPTTGEPARGSTVPIVVAPFRPPADAWKRG